MANQCTFDQSLSLAVAAVREILPDIPPDAVRFIRDMTGHLHVVVPDSTEDSNLTALRTQLAEKLGPYSPPGSTAAMKAEETLDPKALFKEPVLINLVGDFLCYVVERRAMGQDWVHQPVEKKDHPHRFVFYSLKGGLGRSTALLLWGRHLAAQGKKVLLVDLDLEAPGLGAQLLSSDGLPEFGVLDWLVEDLLGTAGDQMVAAMTAESPVSQEPGLVVVPALGARGEKSPENVIAKLARAYLEGEEGNPRESGFASRLQRMLEMLEAREHPDVVLIDSRAGLHETAAANLVHLNAEILLFAADLPVNWQGYRFLFSHLSQFARSAAPGQEPVWRERFKMVHARADGNRESEQGFLSQSYALWMDALYDEVEPQGESESFSFDELDAHAPHWPFTILQSPRFEKFDPLVDLSRVGEKAIREAFIGFFEGLADHLEALGND